MWDNAVKYVANKYAGAIKNHVLVHLVARLKHKLRSECLEPDLAVKAFMEGGQDDELALQDRWMVDAMRNRLGTKDGAEVVTPEALKPDLLAWHFELAKERQSFSPFPMAGLTRSYHLLDNRICEGLFGNGNGTPAGGLFCNRCQYMRLFINICLSSPHQSMAQLSWQLRFPCLLIDLS